MRAREAFSEDVQNKLYCGGVASAGIFAMLATTESEFKDILRDAFFIDVPAGPAGFQMRCR